MLWVRWHRFLHSLYAVRKKHVCHCEKQKRGVNTGQLHKHKHVLTFYQFFEVVGPQNLEHGGPLFPRVCDSQRVLWHYSRLVGNMRADITSVL